MEVKDVEEEDYDGNWEENKTLIFSAFTSPSFQWYERINNIEDLYDFLFFLTESNRWNISNKSLLIFGYILDEWIKYKN